MSREGQWSCEYIKKQLKENLILDTFLSPSQQTEECAQKEGGPVHRTYLVAETQGRYHRHLYSKNSNFTPCSVFCFFAFRNV